MTRLFIVYLTAAVATFLLIGSVQATTVSLISVQDNTLIEDPQGASSAGASFAMFAGRVGTLGAGSLRRAVLRFDTSAIPVGSTVTSVTVQIYRIAQDHNPGPQSTKLHRMLSSWGEGTSSQFFGGGTGGASTPSDATWQHRFYPDVYWSTPGGDFVATASAATTVSAAGSYSWTGAAMIADVQAWVNAPASNFGWCMRGNETTLQAVYKFATREWSLAAQRPKLTVVYDPPPPNPADLNGDGHVNGLDLALLLGAWGRCGSPCPADLNGDQSVNGLDLAQLLGAWG